MSDIAPLFSGEVQFVTYADSSKGGPRVTLRLPDRDQLQAFIGKEGRRFMAVLVEIGDDEQPVPAQQVEQKPKGGELAKLAGILCEDPTFRTWLKREHAYVWSMNEVDGKGIADVAASTLRAVCLIDSRAKLDNDKTAATRFHDLIRKPFHAWSRSERMEVA